MLADERSASDAQPSRKLAVSPKDARVMTQQSNVDSTFVTMCPLARCSRRLTAAGPTSAVDPKRPVRTTALDTQPLSDQYRVDLAGTLGIGSARRWAPAIRWRVPGRTDGSPSCGDRRLEGASDEQEIENQ
jgi:hypothetical protein